MSAVNLLSSLKEKPSDESPKDGSNQEGKFLYRYCLLFFSIYLLFIFINFTCLASLLFTSMDRFFQTTTLSGIKNIPIVILQDLNYAHSSRLCSIQNIMPLDDNFTNLGHKYCKLRKQVTVFFFHRQQRIVSEMVILRLKQIQIRFNVYLFNDYFGWE